MADAITGNTELVATKQDLIASIVLKELQFQAKLSQTVTDVSMFAVKGAKTISFPKLSSFSVINRVSGVAGAASALTAVTDILNLDFNAYVAWIIDSFDEVQTTIQAQIEFARRAASAHGRYVDTQLISKISSVAGLNLNGAVPADITRNDILDMREFLFKNEADMNAVQLVIPADQEKAMLKVDEFTRADIYGSSNIPSGMIGKVYGVPVMVHNGMTAQQAFMYEKSGIALGFQKAPSLSSQSANEYGANALRYAMDQLFGIAGLRIAEKGVAAGKSCLVAKLAD